MKINLKVIAAALLIVATLVLTLNSLQVNSYSGANLNFLVSHGMVEITNPSTDTVPVQLSGGGTRTFTVTSATEGIAGRSARVGTGRDTTQLFEFTLPAGVTQFSVSHVGDVNFAATTETVLKAVVNPVNEGTVRSTLIVAGLVVVGAFFYMSYTTDHQWINMLRGRGVAVTVPPVTVSAESSQGRAARSYGDNRAER